MGSSDFVRSMNKGVQNRGAYGTDLKKGTQNIVISERDLQEGESGRTMTAIKSFPGLLGVGAGVATVAVLGIA